MILQPELIDASGVERDININATDTVKEVEQKFEKQYGLPAHIFRNTMAGGWIQAFDIVKEHRLPVFIAHK